MKQLVFSVQHDWAGFILRITLALIMFPHGAQKFLGIFGGYGFRASLSYFTETMKLPWIIAVAVILIEFIAPISLLVGFAGKLWAVAIAMVMVGAIVTTNYKNGFFMNWFGNQAGEGYEYHLLMIGICVALMATGSGRLSIDSLIR
jgi:putative oxidoreductase